jgi:hypothetical protein
LGSFFRTSSACEPGEGPRAKARLFGLRSAFAPARPRFESLLGLRILPSLLAISFLVRRRERPMTRFAVRLVFLLAALGLSWLSLACDDDSPDGAAQAEADDDNDSAGDDDDDNDNDSGDDDDDDDDDNDDNDNDTCDPDPLPGCTYDESGESGPLRLKAMGHDAWVEQWHLPDYGSHLHVKFTDETQTVVDHYEGHGDSCIWTGTYIASQSMRYHVTGDAQAKANVVRSAAALSRHLHVTGRTGFIARYVGSTDNPGHYVKLAECADDENCHILDDGPYAGDFWIGNTSRDQYTGWFLGLAFAYDLVDDEAMRAQIRADVAEVLDQLIDDHWKIIDVDGQPTSKAPDVLLPMQMSWLIAGYDITGDERYLEKFKLLETPAAQLIFTLNDISFPNRYMQHYGLNLAHENFLGMLRLSQPYCAVHDFLLGRFLRQLRPIVDLQHNPWYTAVYLAQGAPDDAAWQANRAQVLEDLADFPPAPKESYAMTPPPAEIDPISQLLVDLETQFPWLADLIGDVELQAKEGYPVRYQC